MTTIYAERDGNRCILSAKGHARADGAEDGEALEGVQVCAAVSALLYALAGYLANAMEDPMRRLEMFSHRLDSGDVYLDFAGDLECMAAFEAVVVGLAQVARRYPARVKLEQQKI